MSTEKSLSIEDYIKSLKNLQEIAKIYYGLLKETSHHEKFFRKKFKKKTTKNIEVRFWNSLSVFDTDLKTRFSHKKPDKVKPIKVTANEIETTEETMQETKQSLLEFFSTINLNLAKNENKTDDINSAVGFVSQTKEDISSAGNAEETNK